MTGTATMRVLHVVPTLDPAAGGPPRIALQLATATARLGHAVTLMTCAGADRVTVPGDDAVTLWSRCHRRWDGSTA